MDNWTRLIELWEEEKRLLAELRSVLEIMKAGQENLSRAINAVRDSIKGGEDGRKREGRAE